jgi:hypothetical protein
MFYLLNRLVKWFFMLLAAGCLFWLYTQRAVLDPLWVWYDVYENGGMQKTERLPEIKGRGVKILDGHTFEMNSDGRMVSVRLTGFDLPEPPLSAPELQQEKRRRAFLQSAVLNQPLRVEISYSLANNLLGIVHAGSTNLNVYYITNGLGHFNREFIKSTPRDVQYQFFAATHAKTKLEPPPTAVADGK